MRTAVSAIWLAATTLILAGISWTMAAIGIGSILRKKSSNAHQLAPGVCAVGAGAAILSKQARRTWRIANPAFALTAASGAI
jgi:hypothetical protein